MSPVQDSLKYILFHIISAGRHRTHQKPLVPDRRHLRPRHHNQPRARIRHSGIQHEIQSNLEVPRTSCALLGNGRRRARVLLRRYASGHCASGPAAARGSRMRRPIAQVWEIRIGVLDPAADRVTSGQCLPVHFPETEHAEAELGVSFVSGY